VTAVGSEPPGAEGTLPGPGWAVLGDSVTGAVHLRKNQPNQDCWQGLRSGDPASELGPCAVLAVADGHGSAKSFRSAQGAMFAVDVAADELWSNRQQSYQSLRDPEQMRRLAARIVREWRQSVAAHVESHPFSALEAELLPRSEPAALEADGSDYFVVYGTTLLAVLIAADSILYLQLGDGDILTVDGAGVVERPLEKDPALLGNETTSLCQRDAVDRFRCRIQSAQDQWPTMIMLTTDGLPNCYQEDGSFHKFASDLLAALRQRGSTYVQRNLQSTLRYASDHGSGDDVSVVVAYFDPSGGQE